LGLSALIAMVVGSMVGAGIFSLPQAFGRATGPLGALIAWAIAGSGMLTLAFVFQTLSRRKPDLDAGVYAYAKAGFGNYSGFLSAFGYWIGTCLGNTTYFVLIKSTLGAIIPAFGEGNTVPAVAVSSVILWTIHTLILRGVKEAATINTIATIAKIVPIIGFLILVLFHFNYATFAENFYGGGDEISVGYIFGQVRATMLVTVFVFLGIEGASVYSRYARNRRDVGTATLVGFLGVLALLVLVTVLSYGILPRATLASLRNPSMAGVLQAAVGTWGAVFVSVGLIISVLGAYLAWSLLAAEVAYSASKTGTMPAFLAHENKNQVPSSALWLTNGMVQVFLILTLFASEAFTLALKMTSAMNLIPYFFCAAYALKIAARGETYERDPAKDRRNDLAIGGLATIYTAFLIWAGGLDFVLLSAVLYAPGTILYFLARREQQKTIFTPVEVGVFVVVVAGAVAGVISLATGYISI
jgi:arginine:ornithine antiporter/lysine permease